MEKDENPIASWNYAEVWDKFPIPARPCDGELTFLESELISILKQKGELNVLILGSTIEYRSLLNRLDIVPHVVDFSRENFDALSDYSEEKFENEHFIEVDWLKLQDIEKYDIIIGHRAINVIEHDQMKNFFEVMYKALKSDGVFYCRGNIFSPEHKSSLEEVVNSWRKNKDDKYPFFSHIEVELYFYCADKNGYVDYGQARKLVDRWYEEKKKKKKDYELAKLLVSMPDDARFRGLVHKEEIENAYAKCNFSNEGWLVCGHDFGKNMPIMKLVKKI